MSRRSRRARAAFLMAALLSGCGARTDLGAPSPEEDEGALDPNLPSCAPDTSEPPSLKGRVRDFRMSHPDFEGPMGEDTGIARPELGSDGKPVYAGQDGNPTTSGEDAWNAWYHDVPDVNAGMDISLPLKETLNGYAFTDDAFFPIDEQLFGNEGLAHNFHFTTELHTTFQYRGGEILSFEGDDDLWVFINGLLVLDLGGVHGPLSGAVDADTASGPLGLTPGGQYPLDLFAAERHTTGSVFRISLTRFDLCQ